VYLWLCCEGWVRFGPFAWLYLNSASGEIRDQELNLVASRQGEGWVVADGKHDEYPFGGAFIISRTKKHPHPDHGM